MRARQSREEWEADTREFQRVLNERGGFGRFRRDPPWLMVAAAAALVLVFALAGCSAPPVRPQPPVVVAGCHLDKPPPARPRLVFTPCPHEICLDTANAAAWDAYESELRAWATTAWTLCHQ